MNCPIQLAPVFSCEYLMLHIDNMGLDGADMQLAVTCC